MDDETPDLPPELRKTRRSPVAVLGTVLRVLIGVLLIVVLPIAALWFFVFREDGEQVALTNEEGVEVAIEETELGTPTPTATPTPTDEAATPAATPTPTPTPPPTPTAENGDLDADASQVLADFENDIGGRRPVDCPAESGSRTGAINRAGRRADNRILLTFDCGDEPAVALATLPGRVVMVVDDYVQPTSEDRSALLDTAATLPATPPWTAAFLYGNYVVIDHGLIEGIGHVTTITGHLDTVSGLRVGQEVRPGNFVGQLGNTGTSDALGPHLHFEVLIDSEGSATRFGEGDREAFLGSEQRIARDLLDENFLRPSQCAVDLDVATTLPNSDLPYGDATHLGVDFICPAGAEAPPVLAALPGRVVTVVRDFQEVAPEDVSATLGQADELESLPPWMVGLEFGNFVVIDHGIIDDVGHVVTVSANLSDVSSLVPGQLVEAGTVLGRPGRSGIPKSELQLVHWEIVIDDTFLGSGLDRGDTRLVYDSLLFADSANPGEDDDDDPTPDPSSAGDLSDGGETDAATPTPTPEEVSE